MIYFEGLIFDYRLYFYTWLLFAHISCSLAMIKAVFEIVFTDYQEFPIERRTLIANDTSLTLADGLLYTKIPLIQTLAALDLYVLSDDYNKARRKELFALSSVGGHPHNFRKVNEASLKIIQEFVQTLSAVVNTKVNNNNNNQLPPATPARNEKFQQRELNETLGIRNMLTSPTPDMTFVSNGVTSPLKAIPTPQSILSPVKIKQSLHCNVPSSLRSIFGEDKSKKVNQILTNYSEKVTHISQAIASVTVFSLTEDKFGVVQDCLPKIIKTLLDLYQIMEKINAMNLVLAKKSNRNYITARQAAKRSLFKVVKEFKMYFNDMVLDVGTVEALRTFVV